MVIKRINGRAIRINSEKSSPWKYWGMEILSLTFIQGCIKWGNRIKLVGKKIKRGRREGEGKRDEGRGRGSSERDGKARGK